MIKRLLVIATLGIFLSGCFMAPMALIGPATSGFSTASLIQSGVTTGANFMVKKRNAREARNPATNEVVILKDRYIPSFKVSKILKESVNNSILRGF